MNQCTTQCRSHNIRRSKIIEEIGDKLYPIFDFLDWLWNTSGFIPCPIPLVAQKFQLTPTHVTYALMAWRESRLDANK